MELYYKFLELLKNSLHGNESEPLSFSFDEYKKLYDISMQQQVLPMIYEQIHRFESFLSTSDQFQKLWRMKAFSIMGNQAATTSVFLDLYRKMNTLGLHPIIVKGIICRNTYPKPDLRVSSDEDLYIAREDFEAYDTFLKSEGFYDTLTTETESIYDVGYYHPQHSLHIEIHMDLFPRNVSAYDYYNDLFQSDFQTVYTVSIEKTDIRTLTPDQHLIYLLCHMIKHFLHSGFGIRQVCDLLMMIQAYSTELDWDYIFNVLKDYHLYDFFYNLVDIGTQYLGFHWEDLSLSKPTDVILDSSDLLQDIMIGGIFGQEDIDRVHSSNITLDAAANKSSNTTSGILSALFPPKDYMYRNYPYADRHHTLLLFAYTQRIYTYFRKKDSKSIESVQIGKKRVNLLKKYRIIKK